MDIKIRLTIDKCFYAAGYQANENITNAILEAVKEQLPDVTITEFTTRLKKFRLHNRERISVPLIIDLFKPWKTITQY